MTTSTIYGSSIRGQNVMALLAVVPGVTTATVYANLTSLLTTKVTRVQSVNATGSTANPTATFAGTPVSGNALLCVLLRTADNSATVSMPTGWTLLSGGGTAASRRAEIWWRRAGAAEPTTVISVNAALTAWNMTLIEYGGWAALADPVTISAATNVASTTSVSNGANGMLTQVTGLSAGVSWTTATLATSSGSNASLTQLATTTQANVSEVVGYNNSEGAATTFTLGTARGTTRVIAGWPHNMDSTISGLGTLFGVDITASTFGGQIGIEFDTTPVYAANTVSSATLSTLTGTGGSAGTAAVYEAYSVNSTAIAKDATNTRTVWRTPTQITALTRIASRIAGSTWTGGITYAWDSDAAFLTLIAQGTTTRILIALNEQRTGTLSASQQYVALGSSAGNHFLTIVHDRLISIPPTGTVSMTTTPTVSRVAARLRTISTSLTTTPSVTRLAVRLRTISTSLTTTPSVTRVATFLRTITASLTVTPTVTRAAAFARTISTSLTATASLIATYVPLVIQLPRILRLAGRSTIKLVQQSTVRLSTRSTLKLPKE